jgi:hypothetical protein
MLPKKHKSGAQKRKQRKEKEQAAESQRGAVTTQVSRCVNFAKI